MNIRPLFLSASAAAAFMILQGCGTMKIGKILSDPARYHNRNVKVEGNVSQSVGAIVAGYYQVQDDTGKIGVISSGRTPPKGSKVVVSGRVNSGITIGSRSIGTVISESGHKVTRYAKR